MAQRRSRDSDSPTLPLPPPRSKSSRIGLDEFVEAATGAALRAAQAEGLAGGTNLPPRRPIWVGIIIDPWWLTGGHAESVGQANSTEE
ncbi:MAG TPA: hypothetical protein VHB47_20950 [Thermoanaerobaculia bacterium]|nr:hypothetical protein [Thermoanaerobaculia bacterium]